MLSYITNLFDLSSLSQIMSFLKMAPVRKLLSEFDVNTLLRLPTGIFYSLGNRQKTCKSEKPWTEKVWIYNLRTDKHFTLKTKPLQYEDLEDFIKCYNPRVISETGLRV
jgi:type I restriction-modification system DNA methylase subunit